MPKIMVFIFALLLEKLAEEIPTSAPRSKGKKRRSASPVKILPSTQEIMWKTRLEMKIKKKRKTLI